VRQESVRPDADSVEHSRAEPEPGERDDEADDEQRIERHGVLPVAGMARRLRERRRRRVLGRVAREVG